MMIICPATGLECQSSGCTSGIRSCDHWPKAIPTNDRYSAGFKAGREAGMREVGEKLDKVRGVLHELDSAVRGTYCTPQMVAVYDESPLGAKVAEQTCIACVRGLTPHSTQYHCRSCDSRASIIAAIGGDK